MGDILPPNRIATIAAAKGDTMFYTTQGDGQIKLKFKRGCELCIESDQHGDFFILKGEFLDSEGNIIFEPVYSPQFNLSNTNPKIADLLAANNSNVGRNGDNNVRKGIKSINIK
jgi:hypothetical protein